MGDRDREMVGRGARRPQHHLTSERSMRGYDGGLLAASGREQSGSAHTPAGDGGRFHPASTALQHA